eukprot:5161762-Prymnesium_polylepis.1
MARGRRRCRGGRGSKRGRGSAAQAERRARRRRLGRRRCGGRWRRYLTTWAREVSAAVRARRGMLPHPTSSASLCDYRV